MKRIGWVKAPRWDKNKQRKMKILEAWVKFSKRVAKYKGFAAWLSAPGGMQCVNKH